MSSVKTNIVIILAAMSLLVGCGGSPAVTSKPTKTSTLPAPVWLIQPPTETGFLYGTGSAEVYAGDHDLKNPLISPIYGDFSGFPPTYLVSGTRDLFLSDTVRAHRKLRDAGVVADLNVFEGVPHGAYLVPGSGEYNAALGDLKKFLQIHL